MKEDLMRATPGAALAILLGLASAAGAHTALDPSAPDAGLVAGAPALVHVSQPSPRLAQADPKKDAARQAQQKKEVQKRKEAEKRRREQQQRDSQAQAAADSSTRATEPGFVAPLKERPDVEPGESLEAEPAENAPADGTAGGSSEPVVPTTEAGRATEPGFIAPAKQRPGDDLQVNLVTHEAMKGHLLETHVGKTAEELRARLNSRIKTASSFKDYGMATAAVEATLTANYVPIRRWLAGSQQGNYDRLVVNHVMPRPVGISVTRGREVQDVSNVRVVLERVQGAGGDTYRIVTGYPTP